MTSTLKLTLAALALGLTHAAVGQAKPAPPSPTPAPPSKSTPPAAAPLKLYSLDSATQADPFPPVNPKNFTADSPSVATVDSYLRSVLGFDPNRIWRVVAIQKTPAQGVSKVTALVSERGSNARTLTAMFYVLPDGRHLIAPDASGLNPFGAQPFAENRALLKARADGPSRGGASTDLMLVEFADLQCPHCKDAQAIMARLAEDFPKARIVFEDFPLTDIHPFAFQAAAYGVCVARKSSDAFFTYVQSVYDTQGALLPDSGIQTLKAAATKAGADPEAVATCAATEATKARIDASSKLAADLGIESTPMLAVNGRLVSLTAVPYETLKTLIIYQAGLDGVAATVASPRAPVDLKAH